MCIHHANTFKMKRKHFLPTKLWEYFIINVLIVIFITKKWLLIFNNVYTDSLFDGIIWDKPCNLEAAYVIQCQIIKRKSKHSKSPSMLREKNCYNVTNKKIRRNRLDMI